MTFGINGRFKFYGLHEGLDEAAIAEKYFPPI